VSRYDLLPPNATALERDFSRATSNLQRVGPPVPIIRTAKRVDIPDSVVPWLIYEYGLGEILPYLGNDQRLALRDGVLWQRIRGTPESVRVALGWIGIEGLIEEPERGTTRWAEYMLGLSAATQGEEIIDRIAAVARISSPVRSRLQRIYAVYDNRRAVWDECDWDEGAIYDDHSGVRPRPDWPQISYGTRYFGSFATTAIASSAEAQAMATHILAYDSFRYDESDWDEGWHSLNPVGVLTMQEGRSAQYEGQVWGAFRWLQDQPWPDVNVVVSSAMDGTPIDPPILQQVAITGATGGQNSTLNAGDVVALAATWNRPVTVTGAPQMTITIGNASRTASYTSGSGTATLAFAYTIQAGDNDANGISIPANSLSLNGGTIRDGAGNTAALSHSAVPDDPAYLVDTGTPATPGLALQADTGASGSDGVTSNGTILVMNLEPGAVWEYSLNSGSSWSTGSGSTITLPPGTYGVGVIRVRQRDAAGNVSATAQNAAAIVVDTTAPAAPVLTMGPGGAEVTLTAEAGAAVEVVFSRTGGGTVTKTTTGAGATAVSVVLSLAEQQTVGAGSISVSATATDLAGNESAVATGSFDLVIDVGFSYASFADTTGLNLVEVVGVVADAIVLADTNPNYPAGGETGNVWNTTLRKWNRNWSLAWRMEMGSESGNGADGFTVQWFTSATVAGGLGQACGRVQDAGVPYALSIRTWIFNKAALFTENELTSEQNLVFTPRQDLYYWLDYSHTNGTLRMFVSASNTKPGAHSHEFTGIAFPNTEYYVGIGASTGGAVDNHILKAWSLALL
jgi:P2-related tail formation protein